jgi:hypothetical protein
VSPRLAHPSSSVNPRRRGIQNPSAAKDTAKAEAELIKLREGKYWEMLGKGATEPMNSRHYAELSDAAARYKSADPACPPW